MTPSLPAPIGPKTFDETLRDTFANLTQPIRDDQNQLDTLRVDLEHAQKDWEADQKELNLIEDHLRDQRRRLRAQPLSSVDSTPLDYALQQIQLWKRLFYVNPIVLGRRLDNLWFRIKKWLPVRRSAP